jgi:hypothetical protein
MKKAWLLFLVFVLALAPGLRAGEAAKKVSNFTLEEYDGV